MLVSKAYRQESGLEVELLRRRNTNKRKVIDSALCGSSTSSGFENGTTPEMEG